MRPKIGLNGLTVSILIAVFLAIGAPAYAAPLGTAAPDVHVAGWFEDVFGGLFGGNSYDRNSGRGHVELSGLIVRRDGGGTVYLVEDNCPLWVRVTASSNLRIGDGRYGLRFEDLRAGDFIRVEGSAERDVVRADRVSVQPDRGRYPSYDLSIRLEGTVRDIEGGGDVLWVEFDACDLWHRVRAGSADTGWGDWQGRLRDIRTGDRIRVSGRIDDTVLRASVVELLDYGRRPDDWSNREGRETVHGQIVDIDRGLIVVRPEHIPGMDLLSLNVDFGTRVFRDDREMSLSDLRRGESVWIDYHRDARGALIADIIDVGDARHDDDRRWEPWPGRGQHTNFITGRVYTIDPSGGYFGIRGSDFDRTSIIQVTRDTRFDSPLRGLPDLERNDEVRVFLRDNGNRPGLIADRVELINGPQGPRRGNWDDWEEGQSIRIVGVVDAINLRDDWFDVRTSERTIRLLWQDRTQLWIDGRRASLVDLRRGQGVRVDGRITDRGVLAEQIIAN